MSQNAARMPGQAKTLAFGAIIAVVGTALPKGAAGQPEPTGASSSGKPGPIAEASPEAFIARGVEHRRRREDASARAAFERAWLLGGAPRALAQLALAEQALGFWREAHEHLTEALSHAGDAWIAANQKTLTAALEEISSRLGTVELSCNVEYAEVMVDGRLVGRTPLVGGLRLVAGRSVIEVRAEGYFDMARQVQVDAGGISRVNFSLTRITPAASAAAATPETVVPVPSVLDAAGRRGSNAPLRGSPPSLAASDGAGAAREVLTYTSAGLAALGAAVGVTGYVIREVNVRLYNDDERCDQQLGPPRSRECEAEFSAWQRGEVIAIAGSAAAGVFGLTALYLWWTRPATAGAEAGLACALEPAFIRCGSAF